MSGKRIYVGKIAGVQKDDLLKVCQGSGTVLDFMVKETYAFEFSTEDEAQKAIIDLDGRSIKGIRITCEFAKSKGEPDKEYFNTHPRIYVGRLPISVTKEDVIAFFSKFGEVVDILRKDDFAFIEFKEPESARNAIQTMNGGTYMENRLIVEGARPKDCPNELQVPRLYIGKIGPQLKKNDLVQTFQPYGQIVDILMKDDYAFIEFTETRAASRALNELNGARISGSKIVVEEAKPKEGELLQLQNKKGGNQKQGLHDLNEQTYRNRSRRLSPRRSLSRSRSRSEEKLKINQQYRKKQIKI